MMIRLFCIGFCLLVPLSSFGQLENLDKDLGRLFFDTVRFDGRAVPMAFRTHPKHKNLYYVGYREYGRAAVDSLIAGRIVLPDSVTDDTGRRRQVWAHISHESLEVGIADEHASYRKEKILNSGKMGCNGLIAQPSAFLCV